VEAGDLNTIIVCKVESYLLASTGRQVKIRGGLLYIIDITGKLTRSPCL
jgi:hypothetical protein